MKYVSLGVAISLLAGCSSVSNIMDATNVVDYSNHKSVKVLEVPADLDQPEFDRTYLTTVSDAVTSDTGKVTDAVPLVDRSIAAPSLDQVRLVKQGAGLALQIEATSSVWGHVNDALKAMGMTTQSSDQSAGLIKVRDRSLVSDPGSPIGAFLNRTMGKLNQGKEYQVQVAQEGQASTVIFLSKAGGVLPTDEVKPLLLRLQKEYTADAE